MKVLVALSAHFGFGLDMAIAEVLVFVGGFANPWGDYATFGLAALLFKGGVSDEVLLGFDVGGDFLANAGAFYGVITWTDDFRDVIFVPFDFHFAIGAAVFLLIMHLANIKRIAKGEEEKLTIGGKGKEEESVSSDAVSALDAGLQGKPLSAEERDKLKAGDKEFEDLDTGGMGIMLSRLNSREMIYLRENDRNNLTLRFDVD